MTSSRSDDRKLWSRRNLGALAAMLLIFSIMEIRWERVRPIWYDEFGTIMATVQPTLGAMFRAEVPDGNPPLVYLLTRLSFHLFGVNAFALRLPELVGTLVMLAGVYVFVGRRFGAKAGQLAAAVLLTSQIADFYAMEGRPYALIGCCAVLTLVFWQRAAEAERPRTGALVGLAVSLFALVLSHPLGKVYAGAVLVGEGVRMLRARRVDRAMLAAMAVGLSALVIALPYDLHIRRMMLQHVGNHHPGAALPQIYALFLVLFNALTAPLMLVVGSVALLVWWTGRARNAPTPQDATDDAPMHEWVAVIALCCMIPLMWLLIRLTTRYYFGRYSMPGEIGLAMLAVMLCRRLPGRNVVFPALTLAGVLLSVVMLRAHTHENEAPDPAQTVLLGQAAKAQPIVVASALDFPVVWWYSGAPVRQRLHYIADTTEAVKVPDFIPEISLTVEDERHLVPYPVDRLPFLETQSAFYMLQHTPEAPSEWLPQYLRAHGYHLQIVAYDGDRELVEVDAPAR